METIGGCRRLGPTLAGHCSAWLATLPGELPSSWESLRDRGTGTAIQHASRDLAAIPARFPRSRRHPRTLPAISPPSPHASRDLAAIPARPRPASRDLAAISAPFPHPSRDLAAIPARPRHASRDLAAIPAPFPRSRRHPAHPPGGKDPKSIDT
ncbi:hypothetical protein [Arthrobacter sp. StoSoilB20]|uniref:hypothetical protein n=1 Tax=Arthrobacter sp. StoSoilB20 TaxID=2830995 RepID=UPI001CC77F06|nr:hypothetical protein [Arthrobacter sp. StoSoilB20]